MYHSLTRGENQLQGNEINVSFSGQEKQVCYNYFDAQFKGNIMKCVSHGGITWCMTEFSSDYQLCQDRLKSLYIKLKGKPELMVEYDAIFKEQLCTGIVLVFL